MAKIISQFPANVLIHTGVLETAGTILLCYGLAVGFGHVPAWLPMISDCAVQSPEKYPFRLGLVIGASLLALEVLCVYMADKSYSRNKFCLVVGVAASTGLGIVGVVNEKECDPVHSTAAVIFFAGYWIYMIFMTWMAITGEGELSAPSTIIKQLTTILCGIALIIFVVLSMVPGDYSVYLAVCEWMATFDILVFQWSFALDLTYLELAEIRTDTSSKLSLSQAVVQVRWEEAPLMEKKLVL